MFRWRERRSKHTPNSMTFWAISCPSGNASSWLLDISAISAFARFSLGCAPFRFLLCFPSASLLDRQNCFWGSLREPFGVKLFDELRQGQLPRFLLVVIDLAQLRRVHPQFAGHVDLGVRQMVALSRLDPRLHLPILLLRLLGHAIIFPLDNLANIFRV